MTAIDHSSETSMPEKTPVDEKAPETPSFSKTEFLNPDFEPKNLNEIVREGIMLGGGVAAILLQMANPGVAAGLDEHSNITYRITDRMRTTMTFVYCMSFGTPAEKRELVDTITAVHGRVHGTVGGGGPSAGRAYSALDPVLQRWVAATLYVTAVDVYERVFGPVGEAARLDAIYREFSVLACALQVPPALWPATRPRFAAYWEEQVATLEVTDAARRVAHDLLRLPRGPWYARLVMPAVRVVTAEWLPPRIRDAYGCVRRPRTYRMLEAVVKSGYPHLPAKVKEYPVNAYMRDMRKRMAARRPVVGHSG